MSNIEPFHRPPAPCPGDPCLDAGSIDQCWRQIKALRQIIEDILGEMGGPIKTGPIQGITDGSVALPGRVGEVAENLIVFPFTGQPQTVTISVMVLQPGDWQAWGLAALSTTDFSDTLFNADARLNPWPITGVSNRMESSFGIDAGLNNMVMTMRMATIN